MDWAAIKERLRAQTDALGIREEQRSAILEARAARLAEIADAGAAVPAHRRLVFRAGEERYAFALQDVEEVAPEGRVARAPGAPPNVLGLMQLRGEVMPVVALNSSEGGGMVVVVHAGRRRIAVRAGAIEGIESFGDAPGGAITLLEPGGLMGEER